MPIVPTPSDNKLAKAPPLPEVSSIRPNILITNATVESSVATPTVILSVYTAFAMFSVLNMNYSYPNFLPMSAGTMVRIQPTVCSK